MNIQRLFSNKLSFLILSCCAVSYILFRAFSLDITYDEAWTIDIYIPLKYSELLNFDYPNANNHLLNSLLIKYFFSFGNESDFIARLPNVISGFIYVVFAYRIVQEFFVNHKLLLFILLVFNPFLLDFFSLARGYGLSFAFLLGAVYFLLKYRRDIKLGYAFLSLILAGVSVLSSFTMIYFFVAVLFLVFYVSLVSPLSGKRWLILVFGVVIIGWVLLEFIYTPFVKLIESNSLWYGGVDGFYSDSLVSLATAIMGGHRAGNYVDWFLNAFILFFMTVFILKLVDEGVRFSKWNSQTVILFALFFIPIMESMFNHYIFGTKFFIDRSALFLYPLGMLLFVEFSSPTRSLLYGRISKIAVLVVAGSIVVNFILCFNLKSTITWFQDAHTRDVLTHLNEQGEKEKRKIALDASWPFRASILYYLAEKRNSFPHVEFVEAEPENLDTSNADFYMFLGTSLGSVGYYVENEIVPNYKRDTSLYFDREKIVLLKNQ